MPPGISGLSVAANVARLVADLVAATTVLFALSRATAPARQALLVLGLGFAVLAIGDGHYLRDVLAGTFHTGHWEDTGWFAGFGLVGLSTSAPRVAWSDRRDQLEGQLQAVVPYIVLLSAVAVAVQLFRPGRSAQRLRALDVDRRVCHRQRLPDRPPGGTAQAHKAERSQRNCAARAALPSQRGRAPLATCFRPQPDRRRHPRPERHS